jgi:hypothetical protein
MQARISSDLIVEQCPVGCARCAGIYVNMQTGHRIVCKCICHHSKYNNENVETIEENEKNSLISELQGASLVVSPKPQAVATTNHQREE